MLKGMSLWDSLDDQLIRKPYKQHYTNAIENRDKFTNS